MRASLFGFSSLPWGESYTAGEWRAEVWSRAKAKSFTSLRMSFLTVRLGSIRFKSFQIYCNHYNERRQSFLVGPVRTKTRQTYYVLRGQSAIWKPRKLIIDKSIHKPPSDRRLECQNLNLFRPFLTVSGSMSYRLDARRSAVLADRLEVLARTALVPRPTARERTYQNLRISGSG